MLIAEKIQKAEKEISEKYFLPFLKYILHVLRLKMGRAKFSESSLLKIIEFGIKGRSEKKKKQKYPLNLNVEYFKTFLKRIKMTEDLE